MNLRSVTSSPLLGAASDHRASDALQFQAERSQAWDLSYLHGGGQTKERLRHAAEEMESVFVKMMIKAMKDTVPKDELLSGGEGEAVFDDMLTEERARAWSRGGTLGLAKQITEQMGKYL